MVAMEPVDDATNIPIETLRSLLMIMQTGSVTAAATRLRLTQPAVTAQVKRLERLVGGNLFHHSRITERGETVARYARKIVAANDQLIAMVGGEQNLMRVGLPPVMMTSRMRELFTTCRDIEDYMNLDVEPSKLLAQKLLDGFVDVAVVVSEQPRRDAAVRWTERFVWATAKTFELPPGRPVPFLAFPESVSHRVALDVLSTNRIAFKTILSSRDVAAHILLCESGRGVMVLPERFVPSSLIVAEWLPKLPEMEGSICIREGYDSPHLQQALDCLAAAFKT